MWKGIGDCISSPDRFVMSDSIGCHQIPAGKPVWLSYVDADCLLQVGFRSSLPESPILDLMQRKVGVQSLLRILSKFPAKNW